MPNLFVRTTPLPNVAGRLDYISNPDRQEHLLAVYDSAESLLDGQYWQILAKESREAFAQKGKKDTKCREAREFHMLLSNSLLDRMSPEEVAQTLSETIEEKLGLPNRVAVHYNKTKKSFHAHAIIPERHLLQEPEIKIAERNLFFDANGKRRYRKSDILDADGQLLPGCRICRKGEIYQQHYFSNSDTDIKTRAWLKDLKTNVILPLRNGALRGDVEITEYDPSTGKLAQQYVGPKVVDARKKASIEANNEMVKEYNALVDAGKVTHDEAMRNQEEYNKTNDRNAYLAALLEQIRMRERENEERERKKKQVYQTYSRPEWNNSRNGQPYRIRLYDERGRRRSLIELLIILAYVTIRKEHPVKPEDYTIKAKVDYKAQAMMDTMRVAREEGIQRPAEIDERLQQIGKELSKARAEAGRLMGSKTKMDALVRAIADCRQLEEPCQKIYAMPDDLDKQIEMAQNAGNLERYKAAKATLYRAGLAAPEAREAFLERYDDISDKAAAAEKEAADLKAKYHRLSKLRFNVQLAQNRQYCYNLDYCPEPPDPLEEGKEIQTRGPQQEQNQNRLDTPHR